ncbi:MAG: RloB domain-containing protein, partial [Victivallales bacterium]|nr:RloB domain-containing protein [Victivallales bacterium]
MVGKRRRFQRPSGQRRYRKLFVIATEGAKTEPQYFKALDSQHATVHVKPLKGNDRSSPQQVLKRMAEHLRKDGLRKSDEAWLVVDKDQWTDDQLGELHRWAQQEDNYGLALSNPKFEYWMLLHFEDGNGISSVRDCGDRLRR